MNMRIGCRPAVLACSCLLAGAMGAAAQSTIRTTVDTTLATVGDRITLSVAVDHATDASVVWPDSLDLSPFEVLDARLVPQERVGGIARSAVQLSLSAFELGELEIPSFEVSVLHPDGSVDVLSTDRYGVEVASVGVDDTEDIRGIRGPLSIPLSAVRLAMWVLLAVLLLGLAFMGYRRWRRNGGDPVEPAPGPPPRPAHEIAFEALDRLEASRMLEQGRVKEYHIEASDILRRYVEARFAVPALEMTTGEIVGGLEREGVDSETRETLRRFLDRCDMVKFAKVRPTAKDSSGTLRLGRDIVEQSVEHLVGVA